MKCAACGSTALIEGKLQSEDASTIGFQPDDAPAFKRIMGLGRRRVRAYGCIHCQHLELLVEFTAEDVERYQQFEGRQPGVLERIRTDAEDRRFEIIGLMLRGARLTVTMMELSGELKAISCGRSQRHLVLINRRFKDANRHCSLHSDQIVDAALTRIVNDYVTVRTSETELFSASIPGTWEALKGSLEPYRGHDMEAAYEAGYFGYWLHDRLAECGIERFVTPPSLIPQEQAGPAASHLPHLFSRRPDRPYPALI